MKINIKEIFDKDGKSVGKLLWEKESVAFNLTEKNKHERQLIQFSYQNLFKGDGVNIFSNVEKDTVSIIVLNKIDQLENVTLEFDETKY